MMQGDWYIPPCNPAERNRLLATNAANGWRARPGIMDWDHGWTFDPEFATAPLVKPAGTVIRPGRKSGWAPFWIVLTLIVIAAVVVGMVAR